MWQHLWLEDPYVVLILARRGRCWCWFAFSLNSLVFELFSPQNNGWSTWQPRRRAPWLRVPQPAALSRLSLRRPRWDSRHPGKVAASSSSLTNQLCGHFFQLDFNFFVLAVVFDESVSFPTASCRPTWWESSVNWSQWWSCSRMIWRRQAQFTATDCSVWTDDKRPSHTEFNLVKITARGKQIKSYYAIIHKYFHTEWKSWLVSL